MIYLQAFFSLVLILGLIGLTYWVVRRLTGASSGQRLVRVVESVALGDKRTLVVVDVGSRTLLLGTTPHQVCLLSEVELDASLETKPSRPDEEPVLPSAVSFRKLLGALR